MRNTNIAWTMDTWNPWRGCSIVSPGCFNCYAMEMSYRYSGKGQPYEGLAHKINGKARWTNKIRFIPHMLKKPLSWKEPRMIFVNSMSDMFHEAIPLNEIQQVFQVMRDAHWHTFQILTKRGERLLELNSEIKWAENIWMGVSVEDYERTYRIDQLRQTNAHIKFLSMEPLIGPIVSSLDLENIDWVIVGGESGANARPMREQWALDILNDCESSDTAFFMKQMGSVWSNDKNDKKGENINNFPTELQVRQYPCQKTQKTKPLQQLLF